MTVPGKRNSPAKIAWTLYLLPVGLVLLSPFFGPLQWLALAAGAGSAAALAVYFLDGPQSRTGFLLACLPYLLVVFHFLLTDRLDGDSWRSHFPKFNYICDAISSGCYFPPWFPSSGGIRLGYFHINFNQTLPNRAIGYLLYLTLPLSTVAAYKLQYIFGVLLMGLGWWLVLREITVRKTSALVGTLMILMGGTGITFHQEHALATASLVPWFTLALLRTRRSPIYIFPAAIVFGLGLSAHYPQIQFISMGLISAVLLLFRVVRIRHLRPGKVRHWAAVVFLLILAALPAIHVYRASEILASDERRSYETFRARTYPDYLRLHRATFSAAPLYFRQYLFPRWGKVPSDPYPIDIRDRCAFFVGRIGLLLAFLGLILAFRKALPVLVLLILFSGLALGMYGPIPKVLHTIRFPMIDVFRQWVHFFPMVNYCLAALAAISVDRLLNLTRTWQPKRAGGAAAAVIFLLVFDLAAYDARYLGLLWEKTVPGDMREDFYRPVTAETGVFQYKNRLQLYRRCGNAAIPPEAFLTTAILNTGEAGEPEIEEICRLLSRNRVEAVVSIPAKTLNRFFPEGIEGIIRSPAESFPDYGGLRVEASAGEPALLVTPLNFDLEPIAYVNGKITEAFRVNGALTAVLLEKGRHQVYFRIPRDSYRVLVAIQWGLYLLAAGYFLRYRKC